MTQSPQVSRAGSTGFHHSTPRQVAKTPLTVFITEEAKRLLDYYIANCHYEISGMGAVEFVNGHLVITEIKLFTQTVTGAETVLDSLALAEFMDELDVAGQDPSRYRLWWHSHATMSAYFSPTDDHTVSSFGYLPWMLAYVGNHDGDYQCRYDVFPTADQPLHVTKPVRLRVLPDLATTQAIKAEIADKVTVRKPPTPPPAPLVVKRLGTGAKPVKTGA